MQCEGCQQVARLCIDRTVHVYLRASYAASRYCFWWRLSVIVIVIVKRSFYCASYNTCKDQWRITSNGDDSNDDNDNDNEDDNDNNKNIDKVIVILVV